MTMPNVSEATEGHSTHYQACGFNSILQTDIDNQRTNTRERHPAATSLFPFINNSLNQMSADSIIKDFCLNRENLSDYTQAIDEMFTSYTTTDNWCEQSVSKRVNIVNMVQELKELIINIKDNSDRILSPLDNISEATEKQIA